MLVDPPRRASNGNEPSAIIAANRSNSDRYVRSSSPRWRPARSDHSRVSTAICWPLWVTGMAIIRVGSGNDSTDASPSTIVRPSNAALISAASSSLAGAPTQSEK